MSCAFCQDPQGVIVKAFAKEDKQVPFWSHLTCINYIDDIWFEDDAKREYVSGGPKSEAIAILTNPKQKRAQSRCSICKKLGATAALIGCDSNENCDKFHVRCAIAMDLIVDWIKMDKRKMKIYCFNHLHMHVPINKRGRKPKLTK